MYKKVVYTRNVTVALNLTDSLNVTEANLSVNLSKVLHTLQVGSVIFDYIRSYRWVENSMWTNYYENIPFPYNRRRWRRVSPCLAPLGG